MPQSVDYITSNEQHVRLQIHEGRLPIDEAGAELLRIEKAQHEATRSWADERHEGMRKRLNEMAAKVVALGGQP